MAVEVGATDRDAWYLHAEGFLDWGYRQSWDFDELAARRQRSAVEHLVVEDDGEVLGLASVRSKLIPVTGAGVAYVGGGPLTRRGDAGDHDRLRRVLAGLREELVERRRLELRISPPVCPPADLAALTGTYEDAGFRVTGTVAGYRTLLLDLSPGVDDVRAGLAKRWRRDLNRSEREEFTVEAGTGTDLFARFRELFERFIDWKDFDVDHDAAFHEQVHTALPESARYLVVLSSHGGELAGGLVIARTGDTAVYVLGASNPELRKLSPGHHLQWQAIERLIADGIRWYDLGGIDPIANPGGHLFKSGMSKLEARAPGPWSAAPAGWRGRIVPAAEQGRRRLSELSRRIRTSSRGDVA